MLTHKYMRAKVRRELARLRRERDRANYRLFDRDRSLVGAIDALLKVLREVLKP